MSTELRRRRGSSAQHATFTGAQGEITVDLTNECVVVHNGSTPGGKRGATIDDVSNALTDGVGSIWPIYKRPSLEINNAAETERRIFYQTAGVNRWETSADSAAEVGANSGTNFSLRRYDDAGILIDGPITVNRATGLCTITNLASSSAGAAIAGQATGDLGTTAWLVRRTITTQIIAGTDYAGTDLAYYGLNTNNGSPAAIRGSTFGAALSGTYKAMGTTVAIAGDYPINLFVKVAT